MPRVITQTKSNRGAERKCGTCGHVIQPGEKYYKWSFRYGGTRYACSKHYPRRSQLTQSLMGDVYAAIEDAEDTLRGEVVMEDIEERMANVRETVDETAQQYYDASEPFSYQGENYERYEELDSWSQELSSFSTDDHESVDDARGAAEEMLGGCPL